MHARFRVLFQARANPFLKIITVCTASALYGVSIGGISLLVWLKVSAEAFQWNSTYKFLILCILAVIVFTLIYEILFLSKERELDSKRVNEMGRELTHAELLALTNEMDPHFIFNSLNAMSHLILHNPMQAHLFNNNLAQVFKYFLLNKNKELIPLQDELDFINCYFFLLEIRYEKKLRLQMSLGDNYHSIMIPPCALQVLMENAIKHNEFSDVNPLTIKILMNGQFLKVSNNNKPKPYSVNSTNIGLKNLSSRFRLTCHKEIMIEKNKDSFTVSLPLIKESQNLLP
jgi:LytS/YehU family sensor histidine kinase